MRTITSVLVAVALSASLRAEQSTTLWVDPVLGPMESGSVIITGAVLGSPATLGVYVKPVGRDNLIDLASSWRQFPVRRNLPRPDLAVGSTYEQTYSGFSADLSSLTPGRWYVWVVTTNGSGFMQSAPFYLTVSSSLRGWIDAPNPGAASSFGQRFILEGWSLDTDGTPIDKVSACAYQPLQPCRPVGVAFRGIRRDDVRDAFGPSFTDAGWVLETEPLPIGTYDIVVTASNRQGTHLMPMTVRVVVR